MSATILCNGCGQQVPVPEGHTRPKMRCPECGVICDVPASAREKAAASPAPIARAAEPEERDEELPRPSAPSRKRRGVLTCPACGERVRAASGQPLVCPQCGAALSGPTTFAPKPVVLTAPKADAKLEPLLEGTDADDGKPYVVPGDPEQGEQCPACSKWIPRGAVVCTHCGFDRETGRKVQRTYEKVDREWEAGLAFRKRLTIFLILEGIALVVGTIGTIHEGGHFFAFLFTWLVGAGLLSFLLGTYIRINLLRNKKGQVLLTKTWRVCFIPQATSTVPWREHEGVVTGRSHEMTAMDWLVLAVLFPMGIIPGILWWIFFIQPDQFHVALSKDHGFPETILYRGRSEALAKEIAAAIRDVTGLPYDPHA